MVVATPIPEGAIVIAGVGLLALTFQTLSYSRRETIDSIHKIDVTIKSEINNIIDPISDATIALDENILESICKLRRRKAHLLKDNQNFFALFVMAAIILIFIGLIPFLGLNEIHHTILKMVFGWLFFLCLLSGIFYIGRLFFEIHKINME